MKTGVLIDNSWLSGDGEWVEVYDPCSEELIGSVVDASEAQLESCLASSVNGFSKWKDVSPWERSVILKKVAEILKSKVEEISNTITLETGKPLAESKAEVFAASEQFEWYAGEAQRIYGDVISARSLDVDMRVVYQPVGVVAAFTAWNFPILLPARKLAAAIAAGCSVVIKPADETPYTCMELVQACVDSGLLDGVVNMVTGNPEKISSYFVGSPVIKKVSLTGSTRVGKVVLRNTADNITKASLELGGHAPAIVFKDFDGSKAAKSLAGAKFRNCGQVCVSPSRFYIHEDQYEGFLKEFVTYAGSLVLGSGFDEEVNLGPMISKKALNKAINLIDDAVSKGAVVVAGGGKYKDKAKGYFLEPTVLVDVPDDAKLLTEEPFAPIAPIVKFSSYDEVIKKANSSKMGLSSYIFTKEMRIIHRASRDIEAGMIGVNEVSIASAEIPFGGTKESGFGREGGSIGINEYLETKFIKVKVL
ncbi:NAD-dependent succinate-semialdehyde dehydrogenase [Halomonas sp. KAO]|uniref:NAD-dependent succinate-semialdehyde dehydrogenase n=1 Tax=Halomonas sp. KAO TaxID=2783858 RepID=UPI00189EC346|nr:NAD-dependent succinate-semialdehyde dehydrogenase [Halomonas sp. KAO]MBF7052851.1 NAD-dependent succinate-semialdehyde dehydrogenase [Halomonas sp. KAO]